ncbi:hypothetical protein HK098_007509 [Nowakowskiella sp. JEL0407]|nr:hypothetical protein HK098_007509 [Nowakowskiella sp. JEL0407]
MAGANQFPDGGTEAVWVAVYTMFIIWLLGLFIVPMTFRLMNKPRVSGGPTPHDRMSNYCRAARDSFLILLGSTLINQSGYGITPVNVALTWIVLGLCVLWILIGIVFPKWWLELLVLIPIAVLQIINSAFAFRNSPSSRGQ